MRNRLTALTAALIATASAALAQEPTQTTAFGFGPTRLLDTYITQEKFAGQGLSFLNIRESKTSERGWSNVIEHEVSFASADDRADTNTEMEGSYNLYWGRYHQWLMAGDRLRLQAGALANVTLGFIYDTTGSNNPAQARAALNLMPSAIATYGFRLFSRQFALRYELNLPLLGLRFSPNYGQSYYEIFSLGNYDHNVVATTLATAPDFRQQVTLDWQAGRRWALRVGYLGNYQQARVNNLKQHVYSHRVLIGVTKTIGNK